MQNYLRGAYDLHIHTAPDVTPRKFDDIELAESLLSAGMKGCALKCHHGDTAARAVLLQKQFPSLRVFGGVTLNRAMGGLNARAVECSALMGGKLAWFPTLESLTYQEYHHRNDPGFDFSKLLRVLDENGRPLAAAVEVMEVAAQYNLLLGTGHITAAEGMALVREAARHHCRMVLTHADLPSNRYTVEEQREAVRLGAIVEHCYFTTYYGRTPLAEIVEQIRAVGCENVILSTDFGQLNSPGSAEGIDAYAALLLGAGFTENELVQMFCKNPEVFLA